jgi:hypothetical protein
MKDEMLSKLEGFRADLQKLRRDVSAIPGDRVSRVRVRAAADAIATKWVEDLRSPLEHRFKLNGDDIQATSEQMKRLHVLSRPNNWKESYLEVVNAVLNRFDDKFILPIKQTAFEVETVLDLEKLIPGLNPEESDYLREAIDCAAHGFRRAAVVMGWCAAIDRIQKKIVAIGFAQFNNTSKSLKAQGTGKFKNWNKEFFITTLSELQGVFDTDLIVILEGMSLIDGNQADRLRTCFQYRNHSAHPGGAPIEDVHLVAFFTDISQIILRNRNFTV